MTTKEFIVKQTAKQLMPLVGSMSDKNFGRSLSLARRIAPNEFTKSVMNAPIKLREEQYPVVELLRRAFNRPNPMLGENQ